MKHTTMTLLVVLASAVGLSAQSGGPYTIEKSVIAGGGGTSTGGTYSLEGTIGQAVAGGQSTNPPYALQSGFWTSSLAPTSAGVSIDGRLLFRGRAVSGAFVVLTLGDGSIRQVRTNAFGYFRFEDIQAGQSVLFDVVSRRNSFTPRLMDVYDNISGLELEMF